MFKAITNWCKNLITRIKRAVKAAVKAFKEDPEKDEDVLNVTFVPEGNDAFSKVKTKVKEFIKDAYENPIAFSAKMATVTMLLSVPAKIIRSITSGTVTSIKDAKKKYEERTKFYDWNKPGTWYYVKRPMTKREMNYYSTQRNRGMHTPDILRAMGLLIA